MEYPEEPRTPDAHGSPRSRPGQEAEVWLRRELAFLYGVERRIRRRTRLRREAWRAAAVALILAIFAACWYLAALSTDSAASTGNNACPAHSNSAAVGSLHLKTAALKTTAAIGSAGTAGGCSS
jgi:hypothetical protein